MSNWHIEITRKEWFKKARLQEDEKCKFNVEHGARSAELKFLMSFKCEILAFSCTYHYRSWVYWGGANSSTGRGLAVEFDGNSLG
jgi:hypothetical protein